MINEHLKTAINLLEDKKTVVLEVLDVVYMSTYADYFIVAIAQNDRQVAAVMDSFKKNVPVREKANLTIEGKPMDGWVAIQYYEVAVHLFLPAVHEQYRLDELYKDAERVEY